MLVKRTNILFDKDLWDKLTALAKKKKVSIGELTRRAVKDAYFSDEEAMQRDREEAVKGILAFRKKYGKHLATGKDSVTIIREMREERTKHLLQLAKKDSE